MDRAELIAFERDVEARFDAGEIHGPVHLNSDTQAAPLIEIFRDIKRTDWVLGTWRCHMHALLHGVPAEQVMGAILAGRSMMLHFPAHRFMSSAIMGGMLPIACGLAAGGERVWCFVGDMCASIGAFEDAVNFGHGYLNFIIEDNGLATNTPTDAAWGTATNAIKRYRYKRTTNHYQPLPGKHGF
ncbi:MAG: thiamine pyrophosphate-dependent enzyme [Sulfuricaulis sp.]|nr:thiamine pyrophosphate-dependent enzyme [Sulfuricaulis sp.]